MVRDFNPNFYGGGVVTPNSFVFANMQLMQDQEGYAFSMGAPLSLIHI